MLPPPSIEELKKMVESARGLLTTDNEKVLDCPWCGSPMMFMLSDYELGGLVVHNTPMLGCSTCDEVLVNSDVIVPIEAIADGVEVSEIDFREIEKFIDSLPE